MASIVGVVTAVVALTTAILAVFAYFDLRTKRQQREAIGAAFKSTVATLAAGDRVERLGSAILLRRFFNPNSEYSKPDMPYADEAIDVIAATLRGEPVGDVQKVLADGLAYVGERGLRHKDFQRVNLRHGYVSLSGPAGHAVTSARRERRTRGRAASAPATSTPTSSGERPSRPRLDVSHADFFEADISGASFAENLCLNTVFYGATAVETVFRDADLTGADFRTADLRRARFENATLQDADFDGAELAGARFVDAERLPDLVARQLDASGIYRPAEQEDVRRRVFVSAPSVTLPARRDVVDLVCATLEAEDVDPIRVLPDAYQPDKHLDVVKHAMAGCAGLVTVGLPQLAIDTGTWRSGTDDERSLTDELVHSPWNDIETGMAVGLGLPVLSIRAGCEEYGVFGLASLAAGFEQVDSADPETDETLVEVIRRWVQRALA